MSDSFLQLKTCNLKFKLFLYKILINTSFFFDFFRGFKKYPEPGYFFLNFKNKDFNVKLSTSMIIV